MGRLVWCVVLATSSFACTPRGQAEPGREPDMACRDLTPTPAPSVTTDMYPLRLPEGVYAKSADNGHDWEYFESAARGDTLECGLYSGRHPRDPPTHYGRECLNVGAGSARLYTSSGTNGSRWADAFVSYDGVVVAHVTCALVQEGDRARFVRQVVGLMSVQQL